MSTKSMAGRGRTILALAVLAMIPACRRAIQAMSCLAPTLLGRQKEFATHRSSCFAVASNVVPILTAGSSMLAFGFRLNRDWRAVGNSAIGSSCGKRLSKRSPQHIVVRSGEIERFHGLAAPPPGQPCCGRLLPNVGQDQVRGRAWSWRWGLQLGRTIRILMTLLAVAGLGLTTACSDTTGAGKTTGPGKATAAGSRSFKEAPSPRTGKAARAQVYMLRGGFGGVFSIGINDMAEELRSQGIPAKALSWSSEQAVLSAIEKAYAKNRRGPIILVGHSLGAGAVLRISRALTEKGIPVNLVIAMDALGSPPISKGVRRFISYKASGDKDNPGDFKGDPGFNGRIVNVDIRNLPELETTGHWSMVQQEALQERVKRDIVKAYRAG